MHVLERSEKMTEGIKNEDFEIGKVYYCYLNDLEPICGLFFQNTCIRILLDKKLNIAKSNSMKTFLKYMGNGIFCEYYTHKYVLTYDNELVLDGRLYPNIIYRIRKTGIQSMDQDPELILDDICKQEKYLSIINDVLNSLFELNKKQLKNIVNDAWEEALVEDTVRTRLLQLKDVPVFEKK